VKPSYPQGHPTIENKIDGEPLTDLRGNPIAFVAFASTVAALSGPTTIGATVDEEAKLRGEGANPSGEVITTLLQTFRARPGIRAIRCSSAWNTSGSHYGSIKAGDTDANYIARIGAEFMPPMLHGLESVAQWEAAHGNHDAAARIRAHALTLTPESPNAGTWLGNPTLGNASGQPWDGAAVASRVELEALDDETFAEIYEGMTRAEAWLRENASVPRNTGAQGGTALAAAKVTTVATADRTAFADVVIGVAPAGDGSPEWGIVVAGIGASGYVAIADSSAALTSANAAGLLAVLGAGHRASVLCVAREHEARLVAEVAAALSGLGSYAPPVWAAHVYDGAALRTGPLRSVLDAGRLTVAAGLSGLTRAIAAHRPASRSVRVEALACAVARLVACYPWASGPAEQAPLRAVPPVATMIGAAPGIQIRSRLAL